MFIFDSINIAERFKNPVLTIGNYDGLHMGHRLIIERVKKRAREIDGTAMLITFDPHPHHLLRPERELAAITTKEEKKRLIEETGIDVLFILPFTREFAEMSPETFVNTILIGPLTIKGLIIGFDFKFGWHGKGDISFLKKVSREHGFFLEVIPAVTLDGEKIGSNRIRKFVVDGDVERAAKMLGRPYMIAGIVRHGAGRGRLMGFPTINLETEYPLIPNNGVYITQVEVDGRPYQGVTNVGFNPTFGQGQARSIETFMLDFEGDLYDENVKLFFLKRVREEVKFASVDGLKERIGKDIEIAQEYFGSHEKERGMPVP
jgi:riboflavin kinase / FMN adenylyltransferase